MRSPCIDPSGVEEPLKTDGVGYGAAFAIDVEGRIEVSENGASPVNVLSSERFDALPKVLFVPPLRLIGDVNGEEKEIEIWQLACEPPVVAFGRGLCVVFCQSMFGQDADAVLVCRRRGGELVVVLLYKRFEEPFARNSSILSEDNKVGTLLQEGLDDLRVPATSSSTDIPRRDSHPGLFVA